MSTSNTNPKEVDIDYVENLARIELTPEEKGVYKAQTEQFLESFQALLDVDTEGIEATVQPFPLLNVWGEDEPRQGLPVKVALKNAPDQRQNMIAVPKVVE